LPDKAIDVLDEAGSRARIDAMQRPPEIESLSQEIEDVCRQKDEAIGKQDFEKAAQFRDKEKQLRAQREETIEQWKKTRDEQKIIVGEDELLQVVADWTGIPLSRMEKKENAKLLELEKELQNQVIGQDPATVAIAKALQRSRANLKDPKRPIGSFLFMGPTGVGKTHLAKILAEHMFGEQDALIQLDMSEYMEKFAVSRLIGSPPGYVGYEEGGQLTEAIRRKPYAVILFDEIEKAHPDVVQILLQVLEDGRLTDGLGRKVDFRNTILIMTSNVGAHLLQKNTSMGFESAMDPSKDFENSKGKIIEEAKKFFKPEFLNRLSETTIFHPLSKDHMQKIVDLEIEKVAKRLKEQDREIEVSDEAKQFLVKNGWDDKNGARPLRRAIEKYLENSLAEAILAGEVNEDEPIRVIVQKGEKEEDDKLTFEQNQEISEEVS
jgi:ATP-dependent Clp protease ATP-binding subunit ClpC